MTAFTDEMRVQLGELTCSLPRKAGYVNSGKVEYILDTRGDFIFLEMNTRLQAEHPVTGRDLFALQLQVATGPPLLFAQKDVKNTGWAIEAQICSENS